MMLLSRKMALKQIPASVAVNVNDSASGLITISAKQSFLELTMKFSHGANFIKPCKHKNSLSG